MKPPEQVALKDPKDFKFIGKPLKRLDTAEKTNGKGIFGIDVKMPGMLTAVVALHTWMLSSAHSCRN